MIATLAGSMLAFIPSPSVNGLRLGPVTLRAYGLMIAVGVLAGTWVATKRWEARGGKAELVSDVAVWAVPAGLIGARLYHLITDWQLYRGRELHALYIWEGGLGIWGGVALGALVGIWRVRRAGVNPLYLLDMAAPALPIAQAIGRLGNWFNQELFGMPTTLPWGLQIDNAHRPDGYTQFATFHPTFLYELLWCLGLAWLIVLIERWVRLRRGQSFAIYVAGYTLGRWGIENLRIDPANHVDGIRINAIVAPAVCLIAIVALVWLRRSIHPQPTPSHPLSPSEAGWSEAEGESKSSSAG